MTEGFPPSKHQALTQCCFNVGPPSLTAGQHWNNIGATTRRRWPANLKTTLGQGLVFAGSRWTGGRAVDIFLSHNASGPTPRKSASQPSRWASRWPLDWWRHRWCPAPSKDWSLVTLNTQLKIDWFNVVTEMNILLGSWGYGNIIYSLPHINGHSVMSCKRHTYIKYILS